MDIERLLLECDTYEDYLDAFVQPQDLFYLRDRQLARQIVSLGYRYDFFKPMIIDSADLAYPINSYTKNK